MPVAVAVHSRANPLACRCWQLSSPCWLPSPSALRAGTPAPSLAGGAPGETRPHAPTTGNYGPAPPHAAHFVLRGASPRRMGASPVLCADPSRPGWFLPPPRRRKFPSLDSAADRESPSRSSRETHHLLFPSAPAFSRDSGRFPRLLLLCLTDTGRARRAGGGARSACALYGPTHARSPAGPPRSRETRSFGESLWKMAPVVTG